MDVTYFNQIVMIRDSSNAESRVLSEIATGQNDLQLHRSPSSMQLTTISRHDCCDSFRKRVISLLAIGLRSNQRSNPGLLAYNANALLLNYYLLVYTVLSYIAPFTYELTQRTPV
ncbi:hypothetical protein Tcan_10012 [Toxocara canis]|uniref:Uncharacterized protein n=1 Tax=Toxocara canis TaxID=6265 RepID=A0A0B2W3Q6_TOXCA|nr:hypothetical protein Tcan_10012 [Toxocara canis]